MNKFKGGPIFLNSGGSGPDDYLIKPIKGGRWHRVIARWGRHFTGSKKAVAEDRAAMSKVLQATHQVCVGDNAQTWQRGKDHIPTVCWVEFLAKYEETSSRRGGSRPGAGRPKRPDDGRWLKLYKVAVNETEAILLRDWMNPDQRRQVLMAWIDKQIAIEAGKGK